MTPIQPKPLTELSEAEWESLCDGCGWCCLVKLQDEDTGITYYTRVACRLLDLETCRCTRYERRTEEIPDCTPLTPENVNRFEWLPETCSYRLAAAGKELPAWHPLVCGDRNGVHKAGVSVRGIAIPESAVSDPEDLEDYLILEREESEKGDD